MIYLDKEPTIYILTNNNKQYDNCYHIDQDENKLTFMQNNKIKTISNIDICYWEYNL